MNKELLVEKIEGIIRSYQTENCDVNSYSLSMAEEIVEYLIGDGYEKGTTR